MIKLYSTGCPRCKLLKQKLDEKGIDYETVYDKFEIFAKGIQVVPVLEAEETLLNFKDAMKFLDGNLNICNGKETD